MLSLGPSFICQVLFFAGLWRKKANGMEEAKSRGKNLRGITSDEDLEDEEEEEGVKITCKT